MSSRFTFANILNDLIQRSRYSSKTLAELSGVSARTIEKWRAAEVTRPQIVDGLLKVAAALRLNASEATNLLSAAAYPSIQELLEQAQRNEDQHLLLLLRSWMDTSGAPYRETEPSDDIFRSLVGMLRPLPPVYRAAVQRLIEDYETVFGGRDDELAALDAFLEQTKRRYALLLAPTGRGKTALLVHWIARVQATGLWKVIFVPISIRYQTASPEVTLGALAHALAEFHGETEQLRTYNHTPEQLRALVSDYLRRSQQDGRQLLLVLDGVDEAVGWRLSRDLFPRTPGEHLRIVVSARQLANTSLSDWLEQLGWRPGQTYNLTLAGLTADAVSDVMERLGFPAEQLAAGVSLDAEISRVSEGDPLTVRLLLEALKDGTLSPDRLTNLPPGTEAYVRQWLSELEVQSSQSQAVYMLLACCAIALGPLSAEDLQQIAPEIFYQKLQIRRAASAVARFVIGDGSLDSGYVFSHSRLRELFQEDILSQSERQSIQERFVEYGSDWHLEQKQRPSPYLRQFWIAHLAQLQAWDLMSSVLTDVEFVDGQYQQRWARIWYESEGSYAGYLSDLEVLWGWAEANALVAVHLRCALIYASIRSLSGNLPPELLVGLVKVGTTHGRWSMAAALEHVQQIPVLYDRSQALKALLQSGSEFPLEQALWIARTIVQEWPRALALIAVLPHLVKDERAAVYTEAVEAIHNISDQYWTFLSLLELLPHTTGAHREEILGEALAVARASDVGSMRIDHLLKLLPFLRGSQIDEVCAEILTLIGEKRHGWGAVKLFTMLAMYVQPVEQEEMFKKALIAIVREHDRIFSTSLDDENIPVLLADTLPVAMLRQFLDLLFSKFQPEPEIIEAILAVAVRLDPDERAETISKALALARSILFDMHRAKALTFLIPHLAPPEQNEVQLEALAAAREIRYMDWRARVLSNLAAKLPVEEQSNVYTEALTAALFIADEDERAELFTEVMHHISDEHGSTVYDVALATVAGIDDGAYIRSKLHEYLRHGMWRAVNLAIKVPDLSPDVLVEKLSLVLSLRSTSWRVRHIIALIPQLPLEERTNICREGLTATLAISDEQLHTMLLKLIAPYLSAPLLKEAFEAVKLLREAEGYGRLHSRDYIFADAIAEIAPYLPEDLFTEALRYLFEIPDDACNWRVFALRRLSNRYSSSNDTSLLNMVLDALYCPGGRNTFVSELIPEIMAAIAPNLSVDLVRRAVETARALPIGQARALSLVVLARYLAVEQQSQTYTEALEMTLKISYDRERDQTLAKLCQSFPVIRLPEVHRAVQTITDRLVLSHALLDIALRLTGSEQKQVYAEALAVARSITNAGQQAKALLEIAPHLKDSEQKQVYAEVLEAVQYITNNLTRMEVMMTLARHLSGTQQKGAYVQALDAAISSFDITRTYSLATIAPQLAAWLLKSTFGRNEALKIYLGSVKMLAANGRSNFVSDIRVLMAWLAVMIESAELLKIVGSVDDVAHVWP